MPLQPAPPNLCKARRMTPPGGWRGEAVGEIGVLLALALGLQPESEPQASFPLHHSGAEFQALSLQGLDF